MESVGVHTNPPSPKGEIPWYKPNDNNEWWCQSKMGIRETRLLYNAMVKYQELDLPDRPPEEKQFLNFQKNRLFAIIMDYNYLHPQADGE